MPPRASHAPAGEFDASHPATHRPAPTKSAHIPAKPDTAPTDERFDPERLPYSPGRKWRCFALDA